jgi:exonuclease SbcC
LAKPSEQPILVRTIADMGFSDYLGVVPSQLEGCDALLRSPCFQAFVRVIPDFESMLDVWTYWQDRIADYRSRTESLPRDLYLVLIVRAANSSASLENIDRVSGDTLVCRKLVSLVSDGNYRAAVETWPFLSLASGTTIASRTLLNVLEGLEVAGYDTEVLMTLSKWISAENAAHTLARRQPPSVLPIPKLESYAKALPATEEIPHRLRLLRIKDFRGIRFMEVDLSADFVLIHGRNGTGKTSIFDALEWALLGEVQHLDENSFDEGDNRSPYINLFSDQGIAEVDLELDTNEGPATISRSIHLDGVQSLRYGGKTFGDDKAALIEILGDQARNLHVSTLRDLIRSSNFLAQATVRRLFSKRPSDRYSSVSYLLGTHDYAKFLKKVADVEAELAKGASENEGATSAIEQEMAAKRVDLDNLRLQLINSPAGRQLDNELETALQSISTVLTSFHSEISVLSVSRPLLYDEVKALLDVAEQWHRVTVKTSENRLSDIIFIENSTVLLEQREEELRKVRADLLAQDSRHSDIRQTLQAEQARRSALDVQIASHRTALKQTAAAQSALQTVKETLKYEAELTVTLATYSQELGECVEQESGAQKAKDSIGASVAQSAGLRKQLTTRIEANRSKLELLYSIQSRVVDVIRLRGEAKLLTEQLQQLENDLAECRIELTTADESYAQTFAKLNSATKELETLRGTLQRYRSLLSSVRDYLRDHTCPLCGHAYESIDELREHVQQSLQTEPEELIKLENELDFLRGQLKLAIDSQDQLRERIAGYAARVRASRVRMAEIEANRAEVRKLCLVAGFGDRDVEDVEVETRRQEVEKELQLDNEQLAREEEAFSVQSGELSRLESQLNMFSKRRAELDGSIKRIREEISKVLNTRTQALVVLSLPDTTQVANFETELLQRVRRESDSLAQTEQERAASEATIRAIDAERASLEKERALNGQRLPVISSEIEQLKSKRAQILQGNELNNLPRHRQEIENTLERLRALANAIIHARQLCTWLLARSQADSLSRDIGKLEDQRDQFQRSGQVDAAWRDHLSKLRNLISNARHDAERWQLENYGPSISNLYKRFSAHPIFGDLKVTVDQQKEEVRITANITDFLAPYLKRPSRGLAPLQYFSEAQANVLALSIFLTNAFQQRWCRINSVFMDDPVQSMDDLNSNAFIDTMRALATTAGRQFVIATCDLHLYKLMLVKLLCLNSQKRTKFSAYRLDGMSIEGTQLIRDV